MVVQLSEKSDRELVAEALKNRHAFAAIVERYENPLRRYIYHLGCADEQDVNDVLQELFIKCYLNLNDYDPDLKFSSWIYRIAHNETISFLRKKRIQPAPVVTEEEMKIIENIADENDLLENISQAFDVDAVKKALMQVNEKYCQALLLRLFEDKSYPEISDILQIPEGTVATYINRGKKELKDILL